MRTPWVVITAVILSVAAPSFGGGTSCQSGAGFFDYGVHRGNSEAEILAMQLTGELRAADEPYDRIRRDLARIRTTWPILESVVDFPDWVLDQVLLRLDAELPRDDYRELNSYYQMVDENEISVFVLLTFCDSINAEKLSTIYRSLPEVLTASPNQINSPQDNQITVTVQGSTYRYDIVECTQESCFCRREWSVDVAEDGAVSLVSYADLESFNCSNPDVSCCMPGSCTEGSPGDCILLGGTPTGEEPCDGDLDGDGLDSACGDNCPLDPTPDRSDLDGDGVGDVCDPDDDGDGVEDDGDGSGTIGDNPCPHGQVAQCDDNCRIAPNPGQWDLDNDGHGVKCDCAPSDGATYPGAPEVNDALDNQCAGDLGYGIVDEISRGSGFLNPNDRAEYSWARQEGATWYEAVRSDARDFSGGCVAIRTGENRWVDADEPAVRATWYYLVRAIEPNLGSWGAHSSAEERVGICP